MKSPRNYILGGFYTTNSPTGGKAVLLSADLLPVNQDNLNTSVLFSAGRCRIGRNRI